MSSLRPTFEFELPYDCEIVAARLGQELRSEAARTTNIFFGKYAELHIPSKDIRLWSPHLSLYLEGNEDHTRVICRLGPRQEIWTFVWILYLALTFLAFFAVIYTISLWSLGQYTWFGLFPPIAMLGIGLIYLASRVGQSWSSDQMHLLREECAKLFQRSFPAQNG